MVVAAAALLAACQISSTPVAAPVVSVNPHTAATAAVLQAGDVAGLQACAGSGPIAGYLTYLRSVNASLADKHSAEWTQLKALGATDGAITLYASDPGACASEFAAVPSAKGETSIVVAFANEGQADRAWQAGIFGFTPPAPGENPPGTTRGKATGLGDESWTYTNPPIQLATWHKSVFVALVVLSNMDGASFKAATAAVDARLN